MEPTNKFVNPLLTDLYQITMSYAYWKCGHHEDQAVFDLFFRKNPFHGEFTIFAGLEEALRFIANFHFTEDHIKYIQEILPKSDSQYFDWLRSLDCSQIKVYAVAEGSIVFPRIPLLRVEGPLGITQLLETTLLNLVNYSSLIATNAARFRIAAGSDKMMLEFGLRRAQGPDGAVSASRYSYVGGFDGTSNVLAGSLFGIPVRGTHAHSFVQSYSSLQELKECTLLDCAGQKQDFRQLVLAIRSELGFNHTNEGELAAFIAYALAFPTGFLALVDTYDTLQSGVPNFLCVAVALFRSGYVPIGVRLDSGDLAFLSRETRRLFQEIEASTGLDMSHCLIAASNDINESVLLSLNQQGHQIDVFGVGTHLVTSQAQPALGGVYKLVAVNNKPRIKLSQDIKKVTIPGQKEAHRLFGAEGYPLVDLLIRVGEEQPRAGTRVFCRHPFEERKRVYVITREVMPLHQCVWDGKLAYSLPPLADIRQYVIDQLSGFRKDHLRSLNPTPYKVSVSDELYNFMHDLWNNESPIMEIS
ncbi:nicotinate phosphoribosyltransferase [candidate division CSSED10-310 bacterium]|uniref:Nicotinate phosphoribosyltransferase n=1 Tax=candidate division CSSED10-310 bacterium TaxID=2855610 RepID=A0ABV6YYG1_UNCC1